MAALYQVQVAPLLPLAQKKDGEQERKDFNPDLL